MQCAHSRLNLVVSVLSLSEQVAYFAPYPDQQNSPRPCIFQLACPIWPLADEHGSADKPNQAASGLGTVAAARDRTVALTGQLRSAPWAANCSDCGHSFAVTADAAGDRMVCDHADAAVSGGLRRPLIRPSTPADTSRGIASYLLHRQPLADSVQPQEALLPVLHSPASLLLVDGGKDQMALAPAEPELFVLRARGVRIVLVDDDELRAGVVLVSCASNRLFGLLMVPSHECDDLDDVAGLNASPGFLGFDLRLARLVSVDDDGVEAPRGCRLPTCGCARHSPPSP